MEGIKEKVSYCLNCPVKPCSNKGCPLGNNIPEFIKAVKEEDYQKAYEILSETTVLEAVCGRICPHTKQCEGACVRGIKSNPAAIQTRLAALIYLIGYPITFNCKSGKDRTGEVAAEINDLVMTMEANDGEVPDPYKDLTDEEKIQASQIYDATQSDEIARANTGFRGLKVNYKNTINRMGKLKGSARLSKVIAKK